MSSEIYSMYMDVSVSENHVIYRLLTNWRIKNPMIISVDAEKAVSKIQQSFISCS